MTTQPWPAIFGAHSFETAPPADIRQISVRLKSKFSSDLHFKILSPKETSVPIERGDASATTSSAGNRRSARISSMVRMAQGRTSGLPHCESTYIGRGSGCYRHLAPSQVDFLVGGQTSLARDLPLRIVREKWWPNV